MTMPSCGGAGSRPPPPLNTRTREQRQAWRGASARRNHAARAMRRDFVVAEPVQGHTTHGNNTGPDAPPLTHRPSETRGGTRPQLRRSRLAISSSTSHLPTYLVARPLELHYNVRARDRRECRHAGVREHVADEEAHQLWPIAPRRAQRAAELDEPRREHAPALGHVTRGRPVAQQQRVDVDGRREQRNAACHLFGWGKESVARRPRGERAPRCVPRDDERGGRRFLSLEQVPWYYSKPG